MLKAPQANVRRAAVQSLGKRGTPPARRALAALLDDPKMRVRQTAVTLHSSLDNLRQVIL